MKEDESLEVKKQENLGEGATQGKEPASKRCKLCPSCVVARSTILVCLIIFGFVKWGKEIGDFWLAKWVWKLGLLGSLSVLSKLAILV